LQYAFHATRRDCREQGVRYAGVTHQPAKAARAVMGVKDPLHGKPPPKRFWRALLWEVRRASEARVIISSESFAQAPPEAIRRIIADLDPERVHVVVTLRPLARVMTSHWQQAVQDGLRQPLDPWLKTVFDDPASSQAIGFWLRHRHDELIARWAQVIGTENVTVVALDARDHAMVLRVFEQLVGLREHTLPSIDDAMNRSLTLAEASVLQAIAERFEAEHLETWVRKQLVTFGAAAYMKRLTPEPDERKITLPSWAADRAESIAASMKDGIIASGVRVIGDLEALVRVAPTGEIGHGRDGASAAELSIVRSVPPRAAAAAAIGIVLMAGLSHGSAESPASTGSPRGQAAPVEGSPDLELAPSFYLVAVIVHRFRRWVGERVHRIRRAALPGRVG